MSYGYFYPSASANDGQATGGGYFDTSRGWEYVGKYGDATTQNIFVCYQNVTIPKGAIITSAKIRPWISHAAGKNSYTRIYFEKAADPSAVSSNANYFSRSLTTNYVDWNFSGEIWEWQDSPDIKSIIQEIVWQSGWESGNNMQLLWKDDGSGTGNYVSTTMYDYDNNNAYVISLYITWEMPDAFRNEVSFSTPEASSISLERFPDAFVKVWDFPVPSFISQPLAQEPDAFTIENDFPLPGFSISKSIEVPAFKIESSFDHFGYRGIYCPTASYELSMPAPTILLSSNITVPSFRQEIKLDVPLVQIIKPGEFTPYNYLDVVTFNTLESVFYNDYIREPDSILNDHVVLYDSSGNPDLILNGAYDVDTTEEVNGVLYCTFFLPQNDINASSLANELKVRVNGKDFIIRNIKQNKTIQNSVIEVFCEGYWYELGNIMPVSIFDPDEEYQEYTYRESSPVIPMINILNGTEWEAGLISNSIEGNLRNFKVTSNMNVLEALKAIQIVYGGELEFDFVNYRVNLLETMGSDPGVALLFGKNMTELVRERDSTEIVTRLYPFGKDGLNIVKVNSGLPYIEDYTYYSGLKVGKFTDERFTEDTDLLAVATELLAEINKESYIYTIKAADLSFLTKWSHEKFSLGDYIYIYDEELSVNIKTRVLKIISDVKNPENNILELSARSPSLEELLASVEIGEITEELPVVTVDDDAIIEGVDVYFNYDTVDELFIGTLDLGETSSKFKLDYDVDTYSVLIGISEYMLDRNGEPMICCNGLDISLTIDELYLKYETDKSSIMPVNNGYVIVSTEDGINTLSPVSSFSSDSYLDNITLLFTTSDNRRIRVEFLNCLNDGKIEHAINQYSEMVKSTTFTAHSINGESPFNIYDYEAV